MNVLYFYNNAQLSISDSILYPHAVANLRKFQLPATSAVDVELLPKLPEMDSIPQILSTLTEDGYAQMQQRRKKSTAENLIMVATDHSSLNVNQNMN